jgi:hypothetical protein
MYIQRGTQPGRIGRVRLSQTGRTIYYGDLELESLSGRGSKANYFDRASGDEYWISGPRKDGQDTLHPGLVEVDDDVRVEYWRDVRNQPAAVDQKGFRSLGVHAKRATR